MSSKAKVHVSGLASTAPPKLSEIVTVLNPLHGKYFELGVQLDIGIDQLKQMEREDQGSSRRFTEVINLWQKKGENCGWSALADAVERVGGYDKLVRELRERDCTDGISLRPDDRGLDAGSEDTGYSSKDTGDSSGSEHFDEIPGCGCDNPCSVYRLCAKGCPKPATKKVGVVRRREQNQPTVKDVLPPEEEDEDEDYAEDFEKNTKQMRTYFAGFVSDICRSFKNRNITTDEIILYLQNDSPLAMKPRINEMTTATCLEQVFRIVTDQASSWFDYQLIKDLVNYFDDESDKKRLKQYEEHFKKFAEQRLPKRMKHIEVGSGARRGGKQLVIKIDREWEEVNFSDIDKLRGTFASILGIRRRDLYLADIREGCIMLTFMITEELAGRLFPSCSCLTTSQVQLLRDEGVILLRCGKLIWRTSSNQNVAQIGIKQRRRPRSLFNNHSLKKFLYFLTLACFFIFYGVCLTQITSGNPESGGCERIADGIGGPGGQQWYNPFDIWYFTYAIEELKYGGGSPLHIMNSNIEKKLIRAPSCDKAILSGNSWHVNKLQLNKGHYPVKCNHNFGTFSVCYYTNRHSLGKVAGPLLTISLLSEGALNISNSDHYLWFRNEQKSERHNMAGYDYHCGWSLRWQRRDNGGNPAISTETIQACKDMKLQPINDGHHFDFEGSDYNYIACPFYWNYDFFERHNMAGYDYICGWSLRWQNLRRDNGGNPVSSIETIQSYNENLLPFSDGYLFIPFTWKFTRTSNVKTICILKIFKIELSGCGKFCGWSLSMHKFKRNNGGNPAEQLYIIFMKIWNMNIFLRDEGVLERINKYFYFQSGKTACHDKVYGKLKRKNPAEQLYIIFMKMWNMNIFLRDKGALEHISKCHYFQITNGKTARHDKVYGTLNISNVEELNIIPKWKAKNHDSRNTPLHYACNSDPNIKLNISSIGAPGIGNTPLHMACYCIPNLKLNISSIGGHGVGKKILLRMNGFCDPNLVTSCVHGALKLNIIPKWKAKNHDVAGYHGIHVRQLILRRDSGENPADINETTLLYYKNVWHTKRFNGYWYMVHVKQIPDLYAIDAHVREKLIFSSAKVFCQNARKNSIFNGSDMTGCCGWCLREKDGEKDNGGNPVQNIEVFNVICQIMYCNVNIVKGCYASHLPQFSCVLLATLCDHDSQRRKHSGHSVFVFCKWSQRLLRSRVMTTNSRFTTKVYIVESIHIGKAILYYSRPNHYPDKFSH